MSDETELPPDVALLWGLREGARRGPKPSLTVDDIIRAAVEVADAEGLTAVSMARVATDLGNSTMALYRYVRSKDELLLLMSDAALPHPPQLPADEDWRSALWQWTHGILAELRKHPWYAQLRITGPPTGPRNLEWFDRALGGLEGTALDAGEKIAVVMGLTTLVHGQVRLGLDLAAGYAENPAAFGAQYAAILARVVDPRRMPALGKLVSAEVFDDDTPYEVDQSDDFDFALNRYLDGVAAYLEQRTWAAEP